MKQNVATLSENVFIYMINSSGAILEMMHLQLHYNIVDI